jgi:hypothetical protein
VSKVLQTYYTCEQSTTNVLHLWVKYYTRITPVSKVQQSYYTGE